MKNDKGCFRYAMYSIIHRDNQTAFITKNAVKCNVSAIATAGIALVWPRDKMHKFCAIADLRNLPVDGGIYCTYRILQKNVGKDAERGVEDIQKENERMSIWMHLTV